MKIFKLKPGGDKKIVDWGKVLMSEHLAEAVQSLKAENCTHELAKLFEIDGEFYIATHMEGSDTKEAPETELNKVHKKIMDDVIDRRIKMFRVYDIDVASPEASQDV